MDYEISKPKMKTKKLKTLPVRIYLKHIKKDLDSKMVFIGGPRQIGKTTLAISLLKQFKPGHPAYLNWDNEESRRIIIKSVWPKDEPLIVFDEIHKRKGWQTLIKGIWDTWKYNQKFLVTGSARLDVFRKSGDSMMGRYYYYRIHPYTLPELLNNVKGKLKPVEYIELLFKFGGFPEPLIKQDEVELRRWHLQRLSKLVRVDLRDLENISDLDKVELLADALPARVGSLLSYKSLSEDLSVNDKTVKRWIGALDMLYYCFQIAPYGAPKIRAVKKTPKLYLWDWSQIEDHGLRFENMVASHLLKWCDYNQDVMGYKTELRFIRDELGRECDFVIIQNRKPLFAVECKYSDDTPSESIMKLRSKFKNTIPRWYQVWMDTRENNIDSKLIAPDFKILSFSRFCMELKMV